MKVVIEIGVRRQGRVSGQMGSFRSVMKRRIDVPENFTEKELAVAIGVREVDRALLCEGLSSEFDTIEFTVNFEEAA